MHPFGVPFTSIHAKAAALFCPFACGKVIYVDDDANGANDGSRWDDAFNYLQDALYAAGNTGGLVNDIWIAQGTYKPDNGQHETLGDREASFYLQSYRFRVGSF